MSVATAESPRASQVSTPWSSRPPSRLDSRGTSRPETPWTENNEPPQPHTPRSLVRRLVSVTTRRDNAEFLAGVGFVLVLLVAFFLELTDRDAASRWSVATATAAATLGASGAGGAATLQDVCTCAHAEAGLRAAMRSCAGQVESREGDLVQALTLQTAAQAEAVSSLETRLKVTEEARASAEAAAARASTDAEAATLKCGADARTSAGKSRLHAALTAARQRASAAEAAAAAATGAAEDATRVQQRLQARLAVAEAELGLLTAEKALAQTKLTVAEETLVVAAAQCGGPTGSSQFKARADALRAAAAADAAAAAKAVERARAAVSDSVRRADAAFSSSAFNRAAHAKEALWRTRSQVGMLSSATGGRGGDGGFDSASHRSRLGLRGMRLGGRWLLRTLLFGSIRLVWQLRYVGLLIAIGVGIIHVQTGSEEAGGEGPPRAHAPAAAPQTGGTRGWAQRATGAFALVSSAASAVASAGRSAAAATRGPQAPPPGRRPAW